jgi:opacity protein-like surface antigen
MAFTTMLEMGKSGNTQAQADRWTIPTLVSAVALTAGLFASTSAQAQCVGNGSEIGLVGSGLTAVTSMIGTVNTAFMTPGSAFVASTQGAPDQVGGGVWMRTVGGTADTYSNTNFSGSFEKGFDMLGTWIPDSAYDPQPKVSCRTKIGQDFQGIQAGHDIAFLNQGGSGANMHFGVLAGYIGANFKDETPAGAFPEPLGGAMRGNFDVPYAGLYSTYSKGNFFADVQARADFYQGDFSGMRLDARGYSLTGNAGYSLPLGGGLTLEPSVGGVYSRTSVDTIRSAGFMASQLLSGNGGLSGEINVPMQAAMQAQDVESLLGRASIRLSTSVALDGGRIVAVPFVTASVFHEFAGDVKASVSAEGMHGAIDPTDGTFSGDYMWKGTGTLTASRIGTYGQFGVGSSFMFANTGWLGFARLDYRTGDNIESLSGTAGLRYQINSDVGGLKEGGLKDAPAAGRSWTGPYVGVSAGGVRGDVPLSDGTSSIGQDFAGYLASAQAGYNLQTGRFVWGLEAGYGLSNARGAGTTPSPDILSNLGNTVFQDDLKSLGEVTARLGYTFGPALLYAKGGWAFGRVQESQRMVPVPGISDSDASQPDAKWAAGWTAGGGMEFALSDRWSAKAEYMHFELGKQTFDLGKGTVWGAWPADASTKGDSVQIGLNYHIGAGR